jgi:hypothetical protein
VAVLEEINYLDKLHRKMPLGVSEKGGIKEDIQEV